MKSFETLFNEGTGLLKESRIEEARLDAWLLLEYLTKKNRAWFFAHSLEEADDTLVSRYMELIEKRAKHIPLQHLTHQAFFMGYEFYVNEDVLIPRQDTEVLVSEVLTELKNQRHKETCRVLDMCTGSGCILISLLLMCPGISGVGADLSGQALAVASENARRLEVTERAEFVKSDLFSSDFFEKRDGKLLPEYDILVSNPPYIPTEEIQGLAEEVKLHDPFMALDGKEDGLFFYREIAVRAWEILKEEGSLFCEIGYDQGSAVSELFRKAGFQEVRVIRDLAGLDRVVCGKKYGSCHIQEEMNV